MVPDMKSALTTRIFRTCTLIFVVALAGEMALAGQSAAPASSAPPAAQTSASPAAADSVPVLKVTTHLVTVDVVVTDHHGHIVPDLTAKDFQVSEQIMGKKGQREQRIAQFEFVTQKTS